MPRRAPTPIEVETRVLTRSSRRCCLCLLLDQDLREKKGQIAHLDGNAGNCKEDNLAYLCMEHHSLFDSTTSQHKNYTIQEVKQARERLYDRISSSDVRLSIDFAPLAEGFRITFDPRISPAQLKAVLETLARSYRQCGGIGLPIRFDRDGESDV
jgi:hypothetical protein